MEGVVVKTANKSAYIMGDFTPGSLLVSSSGAKLLVVSRRRELLPEYVEMLRLAGVLEDARSVSMSRALLVGGEPPKPGEAVKPFEWPSGRGVYSPEGEVDLLQYSVTPHLSIIGMTGAGKTTLVKILVERAIRKGFNVVIFDVHGEYGDLAQRLGGYAGPPVLPLCELTDQELLAATGLLRVQSPIRMMRYLRFFVKAFCSMAEKTEVNDVYAALQKAAEAMMMLDTINPNVKTLDGRDTLMAEFANSLKETAGNVIYNALKEIVRKDEERIAAAMMYLLWAASASRVALRSNEMPQLYVVNLFESRELFMTSDVTIGLLSYTIRRLVEKRQKAVVVVEEAAKLMADETLAKVLHLALAQTRKFGLMLFLVSQKPGEYVANTRIVAGRVRNSSWARELASVAPQMPSDIARLLPQLRRGDFIYVDDDVVPIRVVP
jgi:Cdc6-like AAA superfamily ATPase